MTARVERLWIKKEHGGAMDVTESMELLAGEGVKGSVNQGSRRQVTLVDFDHWKKVAEGLGSPDLDPVFRRVAFRLVEQSSTSRPRPGAPAVEPRPAPRRS